MRFLAGIMIVAAMLFARVEAGNRKTSADVVKINATATKPDVNGKQTVTITLDIQKGWWMYANPVNHNNEFLDGDQVTVKLAAKEKTQVDVKYPAGKTRRERKEIFDIYEGAVKIEANVVRTKGDTSPLEISIYVRVFDDKSCLAPVTVKIKVN